MHVEPVLASVRAALAQQRVIGGDPTIDEAVGSVIDALGPALRLAAFELAEQAAVEISAQLGDRTVDVVMVEGDPALRVGEPAATADESPSEDFDARITLRLPPSLKHLVENSATDDGNSVNAWVVDALNRRVKPRGGRGRRVTEDFDL